MRKKVTFDGPFIFKPEPIINQYCTCCNIKIGPRQFDVIYFIPKNKGKKDKVSYICFNNVKFFHQMDLSCNDLRYLSENIFNRICSVEEFLHFSLTKKLIEPRFCESNLKKLFRFSEKYLGIFLDIPLCLRWSREFTAQQPIGLTKPFHHFVPVIPNYRVNIKALL